MRKRLAAAILALGALSGCIVHDRYDRRASGPSGPPLAREEVERMAAAGVAESVILEAAEKQGVKKLNADDIVALKKAGASETLIQAAIQAERQEPEVVVIDPPVYRHYDYWHYDYYYPYYWHYPSFGFSYHYHRHRHRSGGSSGRFGVGW